MVSDLFHIRSGMKWPVLLVSCGSVLISVAAEAPPSPSAVTQPAAIVAAPVTQPVTQPATQAATQPDAGGPTPDEISTEKYKVATQGYELAMANHHGGAPGQEVLEWQHKRYDAQNDMDEPKAVLVAFLKEWIQQLKVQEEFEDRMLKIRAGDTQTLLHARYDLLEAEKYLADAQAK